MPVEVCSHAVLQLMPICHTTVSPVLVHFSVLIVTYHSIHYFLQVQLSDWAREVKTNHFAEFTKNFAKGAKVLIESKIALFKN